MPQHVSHSPGKKQDTIARRDIVRGESVRAPARHGLPRWFPEYVKCKESRRIPQFMEDPTNLSEKLNTFFCFLNPRDIVWSWIWVETFEGEESPRNLWLICLLIHVKDTRLYLLPWKSVVLCLSLANFFLTQRMFLFYFSPYCVRRNEFIY